MNVKAIGRSALIATAGLWMCFAGPIRAQQSEAGASDPTAATESPTGDPIAQKKLVKKPAKKQVVTHPRQSGKVVSKGSGARKAGDAETSADDAAPSPAAKAYAPVQAGESPAESALKAMSVQADSVLQTARQGDPNTPQADAPAPSTGQGSADRLNDADRSLSPGPTPTVAPSLAMAPTQTPPAPPAASDSDASLQGTSLLGKIFVAFGALLTIASAARMFMT
jgi:hypothetical protein